MYWFLKATLNLSQHEYIRNQKPKSYYRSSFKKVCTVRKYIIMS